MSNKNKKLLSDNFNRIIRLLFILLLLVAGNNVLQAHAENHDCENIILRVVYDGGLKGEHEPCG